jgi:hypothetical protein
MLPLRAILLNIVLILLPAIKAAASPSSEFTLEFGPRPSHPQRRSLYTTSAECGAHTSCYGISFNTTSGSGHVLEYGDVTPLEDSGLTYYRVSAYINKSNY